MAGEVYGNPRAHSDFVALRCGRLVCPSLICMIDDTRSFGRSLAALPLFLIAAVSAVIVIAVELGLPGCGDARACRGFAISARPATRDRRPVARRSGRPRLPPLAARTNGRGRGRGPRRPRLAASHGCQAGALTSDCPAPPDLRNQHRVQRTFVDLIPKRTGSGHLELQHGDKGRFPPGLFVDTNGQHPGTRG